MKVFGIGLSKTGTSSLAAALGILGYRTRDYPGLQQYRPGDLATFEPGMLDGHDALTDTPVPSFYRELDASFPEAKFILTVRDMDGWLNSCKKQFTERHAAGLSPAHHQLFLDLYDTTVFDAERFRRGYERFTQAVLAHFHGRSADLLVLNVSDGEGWDKLCPFLGRDQPQVPFPKANVTQIRWMKMADLIDIAREAAALLPQGNDEVPRRSLGHLVRARAVLDRWVGALHAGSPGSVEGTRKAMDRLIRDRLAALAPDVPVLSPFSSPSAHADKGRMNHFWLVEPLECGDSASLPAPDQAISIALIEDQQPFYGVVYFPHSGVAYHAVKGKGAFRTGAAGEPVRLAPGTDDSVDAAAGIASRLCRAAAAGSTPGLTLNGVSDWQIAAGDAILRGVGMQVCAADGSRRLAYGDADPVGPLHVGPGS